MKKWTLVAWILLILAKLYVDAAITKYIQTKYFKDCTPPESRIFDFTNLTTILSHDASLAFNGTFAVLRDVNVKLKYKKSVSRCEEVRGAKERCGTLKDALDQDFCASMIPTKDQVYGMKFFRNVKPKFECPFKKGVYDMTGIREEYGEYLKYPIDGYLWKIGGKIFAKDKQVLCMEWAFKIFSQSSKKN